MLVHHVSMLFTAHRCSGPDYRLKENSTGFLVEPSTEARRKTSRVLYPTAQEESSPGFSQGYFRTPVLKNSHPVNCALSHVKFSAVSFYSVTSMVSDRRGCCHGNYVISHLNL